MNVQQNLWYTVVDVRLGAFFFVTVVERCPPDVLFFFLFPAFFGGGDGVLEVVAVPCFAFAWPCAVW